MRRDALAVRVENKSIADAAQMTIPELTVLIGQISEKLKREVLQVESNAGIVQQITHCVDKAGRMIVTQYGKELTQLAAAEKRLVVHCPQPRRDRRAFLL